VNTKALDLEVTDDGRADGAAAHPGLGLRGMAERAAALGGASTSVRATRAAGASTPRFPSSTESAGDSHPGRARRGPADGPRRLPRAADSRDDIEVVGEAATGAEALEQARVLRPDVVVMDIRMPEMNGLEATRRITGDRSLSDTRVLVLTTFELDEYVFGALRAGPAASCSRR